MTTEERMNNIKAFAKAKADIAEMERMSIETTVTRQLNEIKDLQPRIEALIDTAYVCYQNGINIDKFQSSGIHHNLGFAKLTHPDDKYGQFREIVLSIQAGGCCGDFGIEVKRDGFAAEKNDRCVYMTEEAWRDRLSGKFGVVSFPHELKPLYRTPMNDKWTSNFLNNFDSFEKRFYEYIDNLVK